MKSLNPSHVSFIKDIFNNSEFNQLLSIHLTEMTDASATVQLYRGSRHNNFFGGVHGGMYATLIDTACYWAAYSSTDEDAGMSTIDLYVNDLGMSSDSLLTAKATVIKKGRSLITTEASVTDSTGKLLAHGVSKLMVLQQKQVLADALRYTGHIDELGSIPSKFI